MNHLTSAFSSENIDNLENTVLPRLRYQEPGIAHELLGNISDEATLWQEIAIAQKEHPLYRGDYIYNNIFHRLPGGYKWDLVPLEQQQATLDVIVSLGIDINTLLHFPHRRADLRDFITYYEKNDATSQSYLDYLAGQVRYGQISQSDFDLGPKALYESWKKELLAIDMLYAKIYVAMRTKGFSHEALQ